MPPSLFHARMVNLAKPHKVAPDGTVGLENCRTITVLATWWRLWGSAWIQTPAVQKWIATLPETVVCGKGSDAQLTAAQLYQELSRKRYAASLDFTKCYDLMIPEGTVRLLLHGGWPQGICALIRQVWTQQIRWVSWRQHTAPQPLTVGTCCPQGCSFGPLALAVWMAVGARAVQNQLTEIFMRIYMDDRSLVASSASALMGMVRRWGDWSSHVGLMESTAKTQVMAASRQPRQPLKEVVPSTTTEVLGCSSHVGCLGLSAKETQRLQTSVNRIVLIGNLR